MFARRRDSLAIAPRMRRGVQFGLRRARARACAAKERWMTSSGD